MNAFIDKLKEFDLPKLSAGSHSTPNEGMCVLEMVTMIEGERFGWHPECVCGTITPYVVAVNDFIDDEQRQRLIGLIPYLIGSRLDYVELRLKRAVYIENQFVKRIIECKGLDSFTFRFKEHLPNYFAGSEHARLIIMEEMFSEIKHNNIVAFLFDNNIPAKELMDWFIDVIKKTVLLDPDFEPKIEMDECELTRAAILEHFA